MMLKVQEKPKISAETGSAFDITKLDFKVFIKYSLISSKTT